MKTKIIKIVAGVLCLLACASCAPNAQDFLQMSGYDLDGNRTGSVLPSSGTLTSY